MRYTIAVLTVLVLALVASVADAGDLIKPEARCGAPIARAEVQVLDVSELPEKAAQEQIEKQFGAVTVVREATVEAQTTYGRAWKRAEKEAAELGCRYVVVLGQWREATGAVALSGGLVALARKDRVRVWFAQPASQ
jgi:hypothetical protein